MLLKIKRLEEDGKMAVSVDLELGMTFNYLNMSRQVKFNKKEFRVIKRLCSRDDECMCLSFLAGVIRYHLTGSNEKQQHINTISISLCNVKKIPDNF